MGNPLNTLDKAYEGRRDSKPRRNDKPPKGFFRSAYTELVAVGRAVGEVFHVLRPTAKKKLGENRFESETLNSGGTDSLIKRERRTTDFEIMLIKDKIDRICVQTIPDSEPITENCIENEFTEQLELTEQAYELRESIQKKQAALFRGKYEPDQTTKSESLVLSAVSINNETDAGTDRSDVDEESKIRLVFQRRKSREDICKAFASTLNEYLQPVEVMVGKVLRGESDTESMAALLGMLLSLRSVSSRMGFEPLQELLDQFYLRLLIVDGDPRVPITRDIRIAILRDVFKLRAIAGQMGDLNDKRDNDQFV